VRPRGPLALQVISTPGTEYGPCLQACRHRDCAWQRETVARACNLCENPIGFEQPFLEYDGDVAHAACLEERNDGQHPARLH